MTFDNEDREENPDRGRAVEVGPDAGAGANTDADTNTDTDTDANVSPGVAFGCPPATADRLVFTAGTGTGREAVTAFDAALVDAGAGNANLLRVSSVVPEGAVLDTDRSAETVRRTVVPGATYPTVYARTTVEADEDPTYAAVGGCRLTAGYGLNVEVTGRGDREAARRRCRSLLAEMAATRGEDLVDEVAVAYARVSPDDLDDADAVGCAVALALYR